MTVVNLTVDETALGGPVGANGRVTVEYVAGSRGYVAVDGDRVVLPKPVTVRFTAGVFDAPIVQHHDTAPGWPSRVGRGLSSLPWGQRA